ncbi:hypothetical protein CANARDRAFT_6468 [[Candida] arabinofermentans NRRL YB-2248]|uniref:Uncharacterized protein n=1 Tax=[Candida] arabinofermentans NRRL YB-2248 TaxID=983967 RepID=A0A1E4T5F5_9ASCO|nr:hypothetical protein CANARDRAFT_6468 [[Candida] arabinofermentans NRRL YB-2248]
MSLNEKLIPHIDELQLPYDRNGYKRQGSLRNSLKFIAVISIAVIYGSTLLISQINALYTNYHHYKYEHTLLGEVADYRDKTSSTGGKIPLDFNLVRSGAFYPETRSIQWIQTPSSLTDDSGDYVLIDESNYILKTLSNTTFEKVLFSGSKIEYEGSSYEIEDITFSDDLKYALLICEKIHNWRHSFFATYFIYNIEDGTTQSLYDLDSKMNKNIALAKWSPDSLKISFVLENNVYLKDLSDFYHPSLKQLTFDGGAEIFYGKPDWVYEEEVFESDTAMWWAPNSEYLMILRSNDTLVPIYPIPYFVQDVADIYPELREIKYPKPGYSNPIVDFIVYDLQKEFIKTLPNDDLFYNDDDISNDERLITEVKWVGDEQFLIKITNRESDLMKIFIVNSKESMTSKLSRFENGKHSKSWFEISHNTVFIPKSETREYDGYIDIIDVDGFDHIAYFSPPESTEPKILTSGNWEVVDGASAFDFKTNELFFISTEKSSMERHLYSVGLDGSNKKNITNVDEEGWYSASFSKGSRYLLLNYEGPDVPYQKLIDLHLGTSEVLINNNKLKANLKKYDVPEIKFGEVDIGLTESLNYKETLPLNFDPRKKYPLLFFVYGGPGSQLVQKVFSTSFSSVIAAELDAVVVTVDGRGTGYKGKQFRNIVRDNLGHYEVIDQIAVAKKWISKPYIDETKTAIWGWSYGGYMTLKTLEADGGETFKYGMSVAPVTNWLFYDSIYTERYMHTPQENPNYHNSSVHDIKNFTNVTRFLLMHGTGDDNVHFQNSLKFLDLLDLEGLENYDMHVFPDSDHSIRYHNANVVVYDKLFGWLKMAFQGFFENGVKFMPLGDERVEFYG